MERKKIHRFKSKILEVKSITPSTKHITISTPEDFDFYPGQFISISLDKEGRKIRRPYSIASKPTPNSLDLCIKILEKGLGTPIIDKFKAGDEIDVLGPMGAFIIDQESLNKPLIFISTGTGITPFRSITHHLLENNPQQIITLLTGYRYEKDVLYEDEFKELADKNENFSYHRILSRDGNEKGYVQDLVKKNLVPGANYYICGLKEMVNSVKDLLEELGISKEQIFFEKYD